MHSTANSARRHGWLGLGTALGAAAILFASPARAEEPRPSAPPAAAILFAAPAQGEEAPQGGAAAGSGPAPSGAAAKKDDGNGLREDPLKRYYFLGLRVRDVVVPQFMLELFAKGGSTGNAWLIGPELSMRKDSLEIDISIAYADYGYGPAMFKGKNDADIAYEKVTSQLKLGYLTFDLLYEAARTESGMFSFLIGGGVGIAFVAGDLYRTQAYPTDGGAPNPNDPSKWTSCTAAGDGFGNYCDAGNDHYASGGKDYSEKSWIDGGSKPVVFPWLSLPQLSVRFKPHRHFQARGDIGFSVTGFFFGLSAGYGF